MHILLKDSYVESYAVIGSIDNGIEIEDPPAEVLEDFVLHHTAYKLENGQLIFDEDKLAAEQAAAEQAALTARYIPSEAQSAATARAPGRTTAHTRPWRSKPFTARSRATRCR